jgi:preprotein translocase subunit YajC
VSSKLVPFGCLGFVVVGGVVYFFYNGRTLAAKGQVKKFGDEVAPPHKVVVQGGVLAVVDIKDASL